MALKSHFGQLMSSECSFFKCTSSDLFSDNNLMHMKQVLSLLGGFLKLLKDLGMRTLPGRFGVQFCSTEMAKERKTLDESMIRKYKSSYFFMEFNADIGNTLHTYGRLPIATNEETRDFSRQLEDSKVRIES